MTFLKKETKAVATQPPPQPKKMLAKLVWVGGQRRERRREKKKSWWCKRLKEKMALARENSGMQLRYTNLSKNEVSPYSSDISLRQKFILTLHLFTETHRQTHTYTRTHIRIRAHIFRVYLTRNESKKRSQTQPGSFLRINVNAFSRDE